MATDKGVWDLQEVRDKQLASNWNYSAPGDPNRLMTWGYNQDGQLGLNQPTTTAYSSPVSITGQWTKIYRHYGDNYRAVAKESGTLWMWGCNENGVLGQNQGHDVSPRSSPTQVGTENTWNKVWAGEGAIIGNKTDGTLWAWGSNSYGNIAQNNSHTGYSSPTQIGTDTTWTKSVVAGIACAAIKTDGSLWMWGRNWRGGLGQNSHTRRSSPTQVGTDTTWKYIYGNGDSWGAIKTDNTMWTWGRAWGGGLGLNESGNDATSRSSPTQVPGTTWAFIAETGSTGMATKTDGTLWSWGYNTDGNLGLGDSIKRSSPVQLGTDTDWPKAATDENSLYMVPSFRGILKTDGTLWVWDNNTRGELGQNDTIARSSPTQIPGTWDQFMGQGWYGSMLAKTPS